MKEPIVFIARFRIKDNMFEQFSRVYHASIPLTQAEKPETLVQVGHVNEDKTKLTITRLFPDASALDQQLMGSDERSKIVYEFIEPVGFEIYGMPGAFAMERMKKMAEAGVEVEIFPLYAGGFIRL